MKILKNMINHNEGYNRFDKLANYLMNECYLEITKDNKKYKYELMEIEFYFYNEEIHRDTNTHCSESQKKTDMWYLHKSKNDKTFKSGNYKGLDITFGDTDSNSYGGILLRGIKAENEIVAGPSNTVSKIMENLNLKINDMKSLSGLLSTDIYNNLSLKITKKENNNDSSILLRSPRIGLVKIDDYSSYPYRYIKNNSEYREQSNFKDKTLVNYYSLALGINIDEIKKFANLKNLDLDKFLNNLQINKECNLKIFNFLKSLKQ